MNGARPYQVKHRSHAPWALVVVALLGRPPIKSGTDEIIISLRHSRGTVDCNRGVLTAIGQSQREGVEEEEQEQPGAHG